MQIKLETLDYSVGIKSLEGVNISLINALRRNIRLLF